MKLIKSILALAAAVFIGMSAQAASRTDNATIALSGGQTTVQASGNVAGSGTPNWTASQELDPAVASVTQISTGRRPTATIVPAGAGYSTCKYGNNRDTSVWTLNLTVTDSKTEDVALEIGATETADVTCSYSGKYAAGAAGWSAVSSKESVATVSSVSGYGATVKPTITAVAGGKTTITVTNAYVTYTYKVTVKETAVEGEETLTIKDSETSEEYYLDGEYATLTAKVEGSAATAELVEDEEDPGYWMVTIIGKEIGSAKVKLYSGTTLVKVFNVTVIGTDRDETIDLMASETAADITTYMTALKWAMNVNKVADERLTVTITRNADSTATVKISDNGTTAAEEPAVIELIADNELVKTITVNISAKVDKNYLAENTTGDDHSIIDPKDAIIVHAGSTWEYTTVTKGSNWKLTRAEGTYKQYTLSGNFYKYMMINGATPKADTLNLTANEDGTVTFSVTGVESAGTKALILSLQNDDGEIMQVQIIVDQAVEDIKIKKGTTVTRSGTYADSANTRHWAFDNDGSAEENVASLTLKYNGSAAAKTSLSLPAYPDFKWMTSTWNQNFTADITGNKLGSQVIRIARINGTDANSFSTMYQYNVFVYEEQKDEISLEAGETTFKEFTSETAGAWEATSSDESIVTVTEAGWSGTAFTPEIKALKKGTATLTVKNNFVTYTVAVTVEQGTETENFSAAVTDTVEKTIEGGNSAESDDEDVAKISLSDGGTKATISCVGPGDATCRVKDQSNKVIYQYNVKVYEEVYKDLTVVTNAYTEIECSSIKESKWSAESSAPNVVRVVNADGVVSDEFTLSIKGVAAGTAQVIVKNDYVKYTFDVAVEDLIPIDVPTAKTGLVYNGNEQTGVEEGEGYTLTGNIKKDAGDYTATATLADGYIWADGSSDPTDINWSIGYAQATVTANDAEKFEGGEDPTFTATVEGEVAGEEGTIKYTLEREEGEDLGPYTIFAQGAETQGNYKVTYVDGTFWINPKPTITIHVKQGDWIANVKFDGEPVNKDLELSAETTKVELELEAYGLTVPVFKVVRGNETNVTTKVATYAIKDGDTLEFFAEEAKETDPTVTDDDIKTALLESIDAPKPETREAAAKKVNDVVGTDANQVSARELAAYITKNTISSEDIADCDYVAASVKLETKDLITEETEVKIDNLVKAEGDGAMGLTFNVYIDEDQPSLSLVKVEAIKDMVEASSDLTAWDAHKLDVKAEFDDKTSMVTITPKDPTDKAFMRVVIPDDPGVE